MASITTPSRHSGTQQSLGYLLIFISLVAVCVAGQVWLSTLPTRLGALLPLPLALLALGRWLQLRRQEADRQAILGRLTRLPDAFTLLHNLTVRAPWGACHIDYLILSRFGIVVAATGPDTGWITGQVEAVRSLLFRHGVMLPATIVRPLAILPPGSVSPRESDPALPAVPVRRLTLEHLAPSATAQLTQEQVQIITRCLTQSPGTN